MERPVLSSGPSTARHQRLISANRTSPPTAEPLPAWLLRSPGAAGAEDEAEHPGTGKGPEGTRSPSLPIVVKGQPRPREREGPSPRRRRPTLGPESAQCAQSQAHGPPHGPGPPPTANLGISAGSRPWSGPPHPPIKGRNSPAGKAKPLPHRGPLLRPLGAADPTARPQQGRRADPQLARLRAATQGAAACHPATATQALAPDNNHAGRRNHNMNRGAWAAGWNACDTGLLRS